MRIFFFMYKSICFLKRERPETDDFEKKNIWLWRINTKYNFNISRNAKLFLQVLGDTLTKYSENVFAYSCVSEHYEYFLFFPYKNLQNFLSGQVRKECNFYVVRTLKKHFGLFACLHLYGNSTIFGFFLYDCRLT